MLHIHARLTYTVCKVLLGVALQSRCTFWLWKHGGYIEKWREVYVAYTTLNVGHQIYTFLLW